MLAETRNAGLYRDMVDQITHDDVKDALRYFVGLAAEDAQYTCYPHQKGSVDTFRFEDQQGRRPFSFIVNRGSLVFHFRKPAVQSKKWTKELLADHFDSLNENAAGELTVTLRSIADVRRLWRLIGADAVQFRSGTSKTTQIGYVNPNRQRCAGSRGVSGTDHGQVAYRMECEIPGCGHVYGSNGTDVFQRKCPYCQDGRPGIEF